MRQNTRKVTANLPEETLREAQRITRKGVTLTLIEGLLELQKREKRSALRSLRGKVHFELDLDATRR